MPLRVNTKLPDGGKVKQCLGRLLISYGGTRGEAVCGTYVSPERGEGKVIRNSVITNEERVSVWLPVVVFPRNTAVS